MKPINSPQSAHDVLMREFRPASIVVSSAEDQIAYAEDAFQFSVVADPALISTPRYTLYRIGTKYRSGQSERSDVSH
jgi:hypothetical protein